MPTVHCSAFAAADGDWAAACIRRVSAAVYGYPPPAAAAAAGAAADTGRPTLPGASARIVRQVAPNKVHVCVKFVLPRAVAFDDRGGGAAAAAPTAPSTGAVEGG